MKAFLLGASLAAMLAGCAQHGELQITAVGKEAMRADDGTLAKAQLLLSRGEYALAVDAYRKAVRYDASNAAAYNGLAIAYDQLGRHDLSRRNYELALAYAPREAKYYRNLARSLERQGLKSDADRVLAQLDATGNISAPAPASSPERPSLRTLALIASEQATAIADAAAGAVRPHLERLSMGEVRLATIGGDARVRAGRSITVPIPAAGMPVEEPQIAARAVGHSITVEIPPALPAKATLAALAEEGIRSEILVDIPLATLQSAQAVELSHIGPQTLIAAAADPEELLSFAFDPDAACNEPVQQGRISENDFALSGMDPQVFTGNFTSVRLGRTDVAIDLPLLYSASANFPAENRNGTKTPTCNIRLADTLPAYDVLFNSIWLDWNGVA